MFRTLFCEEIVGQWEGVWEILIARNRSDVIVVMIYYSRVHTSSGSSDA